MSMRSWPALLSLAIAGTALSGASSPPAEPEVRLSGDRAKVEDTEGTGVFVIGTDEAIFQRLGNPKHRVFAWDAPRKRVRITPLNREGLWIQCIYLRAIPGQCNGGLTTAEMNAETTQTKGFSAAMSGSRPAALAAHPARPGRAPGRALPKCPGDPRCP